MATSEHFTPLTNGKGSRAPKLSLPYNAFVPSGGKITKVTKNGTVLFYIFPILQDKRILEYTNLYYPDHEVKSSVRRHFAPDVSQCYGKAI